MRPKIITEAERSPPAPEAGDGFARAAPRSIKDRLQQTLLRVPGIAARRAEAGVRYRAKPARWRRARGAVTFCFDGVPRSAWTTGGAILARHGVKGVYYLSQEFGPGGACASYESADVAAMVAAGHEIGCMPSADKDTAIGAPAPFHHSVEANLAFLSQFTPARAPMSFAYAPGAAGPSAKKLCAELFMTARGGIVGCNVDEVDAAQLHAIGLEARSLDRLDFAHFVQAAARSGAWLCIYTRDVAENPSPLGCTPAALDQAIRLALSAGLDPLTAAEAAVDGLVFAEAQSDD